MLISATANDLKAPREKRGTKRGPKRLKILDCAGKIAATRAERPDSHRPAARRTTADGSLQRRNTLGWRGGRKAGALCGTRATGAVPRGRRRWRARTR